MLAPLVASLIWRSSLHKHLTGSHAMRLICLKTIGARPRP